MLFCFNGTDAAEREQRVLAHYAEPQGGKALEEGLKRKAREREFKEIREYREFSDCVNH